jgi:hypothetical protein
MMMQLKVRQDVFLVGELSLAGPLRAVTDLRPKLARAAELATLRGWERAYVILPEANVRGNQIVDADGGVVKLPQQQCQMLRVLAAVTDKDALTLLFTMGDGGWCDLNGGAGGAEGEPMVSIASRLPFAL